MIEFKYRLHDDGEGYERVKSQQRIAESALNEKADQYYFTTGKEYDPFEN